MSTLAGMGSRLAELIRNTGLSQNEFSAQLGVSSGFVSDVVRGLKRPGSEFLHSLRETFGVSIDWLLDGTGTMFGGSPVDIGLFKLVAAEVALARHAVVQGDAKAKQLVARLLAQGDAASLKDPKLLALLQQYASHNDDALMAAVLYNSHVWTPKTDERVRNALSGALAQFEANRPLEVSTGTTDSSNEGPQSTASKQGASVVSQVNLGKSVRAAAANYYERGKGPRKP